MGLDLLVLDDGVIRSMLQDVRYLNAIPCLAEGKRQLEGATSQAAAGLPCHRCHKKHRTSQADVMNSIKSCITALPLAKRNELRQLTQARRIRVIKLTPRGTIKVTF